MIRTLADRVGLDPWDIDPKSLRDFVETHESAPMSRYRVGSPCRFIRRLDLFVHVVVPEMVVERHPLWACYLRTTSPRWGKAWRGWGDVK